MDQQITLSIIVPVYNVEEYVAECLDSLEAQRLENFEVIIVDDGSTDSSGQLAQGYAQRLPHFRYFSQENSGQGQARNTGVSHARGTYLAFCDSDDIVPERAYQHLVELAENTGSDIAVGTAVQFNSQGRMPSVLHKHAFAHAPQRLSLRTWPQLLYDNIVCDKVIRRDFYQASGTRFPGGMAYEDVATMVPMLCKTDKIAYLDEVVYLWRKRDGQTLSTTQSRVLPGNLEDRLKAIQIIDEYFAAHVDDLQLVHAKDRKIVDFDLILFVNSLPDAQPERCAEMVELLAAAVEQRAECLDELDPLKRIKYYYLLKRDMAGLFRAIEYGEEEYAAVSARRRADGHFEGDFPFEDLPPELADMTRAFAKNRCSTRIKAASLGKEQCAIEGYAYLRGYEWGPDASCALAARLVPLDAAGQSAAASAAGGAAGAGALRDGVWDGSLASSAALLDGANAASTGTSQGGVAGSAGSDVLGGIDLDVKVQMVPNDCIESKGAPAHLCAFTATLLTKRLRAAAVGTYRLAVQLSCGGFTCEPVFAGRALEGRAARPYALRDGKRFYTVRYRVWRDFSLCVNDVDMPRIKSIASDGGDLLITDASKAQHRVPEADIDFEAKRIGDPARVPYAYFARIPLLAPYKGGVIRLGRSTQGSPVVSMLADTKFVLAASTGTDTDAMRLSVAEGSESLAHATGVPGAMDANAAASEGADPLSITVGEFDGTTLDGAWALRLVGKDSEQGLDVCRAQAGADGRVAFALDQQVASLPDGSYSLELVEGSGGQAHPLRCLPADMKQKTELRLATGGANITLKLTSVRPTLLIEHN